MRLLELMALSSDVALALTDNGWCLTDGRRFTEPYSSWDTAMDDRDTQAALRFGLPTPSDRKEWRYV